LEVVSGALMLQNLSLGRDLQLSNLRADGGWIVKALRYTLYLIFGILNGSGRLESKHRVHRIHSCLTCGAMVLGCGAGIQQGRYGSPLAVYYWNFKGI
jgi:hypothetical protein